RKVALHPKSINESERRFEHSWLVYWQKVKTSKVYLYDTTMISNYPLLLFGQKLEYDSKEKVINVDGFVKVRCDKQIADVIQKLRKELDELLEYKISHPGTTDWSESKEGKLLSLIVQILSKEREPAPQEDFFEDNYRDEEDDAY
ncbi:UNVERIFIED_CONTAM: hypothetical protein GTU68_057752, partial [Idotea baltica]|nr:hypothetical protein [Idotea baltica]